MTPQEIKVLIETNPDFINIKRFEFSLKKLIDKYPDGVPTKLICAALQMSEAEVDLLYKKVLLKLKDKLE